MNPMFAPLAPILKRELLQKLDDIQACVAAARQWVELDMPIKDDVQQRLADNGINKITLGFFEIWDLRNSTKIFSR